ncbi:MAG: class I SAM-dependent methyltransferase [Clostridia bacterium]|nr:class I SAM-dependent methyltransferase [Clostridia bacterium]
MNVVNHYDLLIDEDNDPFHDPPELQEYMDQWDGAAFIDQMQLDSGKTVLEIGIGTGRIARKVAPCCFQLTGIDISPKTIERAAANLSDFSNVSLICDDFLHHSFSETFDVVYSSLTLMHFEDKAAFIGKAAALLRPNGRLCLSIDKNQDDFIDMGSRKLKIYPDTPENILGLISKTSLEAVNLLETPFANIIICRKP